MLLSSVPALQTATLPNYILCWNNHVFPFWPLLHIIHYFYLSPVHLNKKKTCTLRGARNTISLLNYLNAQFFNARVGARWRRKTPTAHSCFLLDGSIDADLAADGLHHILSEINYWLYPWFFQAHKQYVLSSVWFNFVTFVHFWWHHHYHYHQQRFDRQQWNVQGQSQSIYCKLVSFQQGSLAWTICSLLRN